MAAGSPCVIERQLMVVVVLAFRSPSEAGISSAATCGTFRPWSLSRRTARRSWGRLRSASALYRAWNGRGSS